MKSKKPRKIRKVYVYNSVSAEHREELVRRVTFIVNKGN